MEVSFLYADGDGVKMYQFKSKDSKIKEYIHCAWEIIQSGCLKKTELNRYICFSVDYNAVDISDIWDIYT